METIALIVSQFAFGLFRTLNVKQVAGGKVAMAMVSGLMVKATWLVSSAIGVNAVIGQDWSTACIYILSALGGDYLALKLK
jgi:hypothetical protein